MLLSLAATQVTPLHTTQSSAVISLWFAALMLLPPLLGSHTRTCDKASLKLPQLQGKGEVNFEVGVWG